MIKKQNLDYKIKTCSVICSEKNSKKKMSKRQTYLGLLAKDGEIEQEQLDEELEDGELDHINIVFDQNETKTPEIAFVEVEDNNLEKDYRNKLKNRYVVQRINKSNFSRIFDVITNEDLIQENGSLDLSGVQLLQNIKWFDTGNMLLSIAFVNKHNSINQKGGLILPQNLDNDDFKHKLSFILPNAFPREQRNENPQQRTIISRKFKRSDDESESEEERKPQINRNFSKSVPMKSFNKNRPQQQQQLKNDDTPKQFPPQREMRKEQTPEAQTEQQPQYQQQQQQQSERYQEARNSAYSNVTPTAVRSEKPTLGKRVSSAAPEKHSHSQVSVELEEDFPPNGFINDFNNISEMNIDATWQFYDQNCKFSMTAEEEMYVNRYSRNLLNQDINLVIGDPTNALKELLEKDQESYKYFNVEAVMSSAITDTIFSVVLSGTASLIYDGIVNFERVLTLIQIGDGKDDFRIVSDQIHFSK